MPKTPQWSRGLSGGGFTGVMPPPTYEKSGRNSRIPEREERVARRRRVVGRRIIGRVMQPAAFLPPARRADDEIGHGRQVAELDEPLGDLRALVKVLDLVADELQPPGRPVEPEVRADDPDVVPHDL